MVYRQMMVVFVLLSLLIGCESDREDSASREREVDVQVDRQGEARQAAVVADSGCALLDAYAQVNDDLLRTLGTFEEVGATKQVMDRFLEVAQQDGVSLRAFALSEEAFQALPDALRHDMSYVNLRRGKQLRALIEAVVAHAGALTTAGDAERAQAFYDAALAVGKDNTGDDLHLFANLTGDAIVQYVEASRGSGE